MKKGGKLIGQGSFGCVYKPALRCKGAKRIEDGYVSKLMERENALLEIEEQKNVDEIDPDFHFHLPMGEACVPEKPEKKHDNLLKDCFVQGWDAYNTAKNIYYNVFSKKFMNVHLKDGGTSLSSYLKNNAKDMKSLKHCEMMLYDFTRLIFGLYRFSDHHIGHFDIKTNNIVYDKKSNRFNYIDFGKMGTAFEFMKKHAQIYQFYEIVPFEIIFAEPDEKVNTLLDTIVELGILGVDVEKDVDIITTALGALFTGGERHAWFIRAIIDDVNKGYYKLGTKGRMLRDYIEYSKQLGLMGKTVKTIRKIIKAEIVVSIDVYSLSLVMIEMISAMADSHVSDPKKRIMAPDDEENNEEENEAYAVYLGSISKSFEAFFRLAIKMNIQSFVERISPQDAYVVYLKEIYAPIRSKYGLKRLGFVNDNILNQIGLENNTTFYTPSSPKTSQKSSHKSSHKLTKKKCKANEVVNPKTNRCIKKNGPIHNKLKREGIIGEQHSRESIKSSLKHTSPLKLQSAKNKKSKSKHCGPMEVENPLTKRCIKKGGPTYKTLKKKGILS